MSFMRAWRRPCSLRMHEGCSDRPLPACCGANSSIIMMSTAGSRAILLGRSLRTSGSHGRNSDWTHLYNADVISMPDKWEYPWYAAWDLAFHCLPIALVDSRLPRSNSFSCCANGTCIPNGQIPAYEWAFGDVNPPVHAWAAWRVYKIEKKRKGSGIACFSSGCFISCC